MSADSLNRWLQFTRTLPSSDSVLARNAELRRVRRERHFMSKKSCKAAESIEDALLRMARVNSNNSWASIDFPRLWRSQNRLIKCYNYITWLASSYQIRQLLSSVRPVRILLSRLQKRRVKNNPFPHAFFVLFLSETTVFSLSSSDDSLTMLLRQMPRLWYYFSKKRDVRLPVRNDRYFF